MQLIERKISKVTKTFLNQSHTKITKRSKCKSTDRDITKDKEITPWLIQKQK